MIDAITKQWALYWPTAGRARIVHAGETHDVRKGTSSGTKRLHEGAGGRPSLSGERGVVGQGVGGEQVRFDGRRHEGATVVRRLHPQEPAGLSQIDEIDDRAEMRFQPTSGIEKRDRVQSIVAKDGDIDVAVVAGLIPGLAAIEPGPQQASIGKGYGHFVAQRFGKAGD
jgi:hypothetical protein